MATLSNLYENTVAVRIGGKEHRDWLSYDIDSDFLIPADGFDFELAVSSEQGKVAKSSSMTKRF